MNEEQEQAFRTAWDFQMQLLAEELAAARDQAVEKYRNRGLNGHPPARMARVSMNMTLVNLLISRSQ